MSVSCPICNSVLPDGASVCPGCGYHVSGSTESFKPIPFTSGSSRDSIKLEQRYELRVVRGPKTGVDIDLHHGSLTVGRDPQCDIFLNDMTVSRSHAVIDVTDKGCIIKDMNSFNGVWVNDRMVETCLLKAGDLIQIGAFCLVFRERP